ncbi:MAG: zinc-ribbon domain-containing protein [Thermoplasmata archaeon]|nr:zinc-ribbon domain-containing protein [Thermoplasmata archaeon]MCI4359938.1 zinc-ribbon domain-containing protein [Thermoplasmata archaeon]
MSPPGSLRRPPLPTRNFTRGISLALSVLLAISATLYLGAMVGSRTGPGPLTYLAPSGTEARGWEEAHPHSAAAVLASSLSVTLTLSPSTLNENTQLTINFQITGGQSPYQLRWSNLPNGCSSGSAPSSEATQAPQTFSCSPTQSGSFGVSVQVTDSSSPTPNSITSQTQTIQVNPNGNGNNGNHNGSGNGGSGNGSLAAFSSLGSLLPILFLGVIVAFALLVITAVSSLATAILIARRMPARTRGEEIPVTHPCSSCGKAVALDSKFCPACGKPVVAEKTNP